MDDKTSIEQVATELREARNNYERASSHASMARNAECDALNRLNRAQKAFDQAVAEMKKGHPSDSDWGPNNRHTVGIAG